MYLEWLICFKRKTIGKHVCYHEEVARPRFWESFIYFYFFSHVVFSAWAAPLELRGLSVRLWSWVNNLTYTKKDVTTNVMSPPEATDKHTSRPLAAAWSKIACQQAWSRIFPPKKTSVRTLRRMFSEPCFWRSQSTLAVTRQMSTSASRKYNVKQRHPKHELVCTMWWVQNCQCDGNLDLEVRTPQARPC